MLRLCITKICCNGSNASPCVVLLPCFCFLPGFERLSTGFTAAHPLHTISLLKEIKTKYGQIKRAYCPAKLYTLQR